MNPSDQKHYQVYSSISGHFVFFDTVEGAAIAFFEADVQERPSVIFGNSRSAQVLARTIVIGDRFEKSLPVETNAAFTDAFLKRKLRKLPPP